MNKTTEDILEIVKHNDYQTKASFINGARFALKIAKGYDEVCKELTNEIEKILNEPVQSKS